jgi:hypothetical protein
MLYPIPGDLNEGEQRGNLFVIQCISTARIGEIVRGTYPYYVIFLAVSRSSRSWRYGCRSKWHAPTELNRYLPDVRAATSILTRPLTRSTIGAHSLGPRR